MAIRLSKDTVSGGVVRLPPADSVEHEQIATAIRDYEQAQARAQQARQDATHLQQVKRPEAALRDAELLADSLQAGSDEDPGTPNVEQADIEIAAAIRHAEAAAIVRARAVAALQDALAEHGDDWIEVVNAAHDEAAVEWQRLLDNIAEMYSELAALESLQSFGATGSYFEPGGLSAWVGRSEVGLDEALARLRAHAQPPAVERVLKSA